MKKLRDILIDEKEGGLSTLSYAALYFLLAHIFFWRLLVPGQMLFGTDIQNQSYPMQMMAVGEMLKGGSLMLWNPYIFSGMPFLASFSFPFFYPFALMFFALPLGFAMGYEIIIHFFLMGFFMFVFLRDLGLSRKAAFIGGILFMFNAHLVSLVYPGHGGKIFTMTYLPLALLFLNRALDSNRLRDMALMGLMVGLMFYAGHVQILFYCGITLLLFLLVRVALDVRGKGLGWAVKSAAGFCVAFALATMLYAVILLPAWEYRGFTHRAGGVTGASSYEFATSFSQPPEDMLYVMLRNPFGWGKDYGPNVPTTGGIFYRGRIGLRLSVDYFSVFGLVLAVIGASFRRDRYTWFFTGLALLSVFLALGGFNPLYVYVYKYVPGFSLFRVPYAIMILLPFCGSVLAAFGMQYLLEEGRAGSWRRFGSLVAACAGISAAVLAAALYWKSGAPATAERLLRFEWVRQMLWGYYDDLAVRFHFFLNNLFVFATFLAASALLLFLYRRGMLKAKLFAAAACALILVDLWPVGWDFIKTVPNSSIEQVYFRETPQIKALKDDKGGMFRVFSMVTNNELLYHGIQSLTGYHAVPLGYYENTLNRMTFDNAVLDLLNTKYLMLPKEPEYDFRNYPDTSAKEALSKKYELVDESGSFLYRNLSPLPRAWLVGAVWRVDNIGQALDVVSDPRFAPVKAAVVSEDPGPEVGIDPAGDLSAQKVSVSSYSADRMEFDVFSPADSFMVVSEIWYPGWKAYLDGREARVYRTDYLLRGIAMPRGEHKVEMVFEPPLFRLGGAVSALTALVFAGIIGWPAIRRRTGRA